MRNENLVYTAAYGVYPLWTVKCHGILNIQRNSGCDSCPSSTLVFLSSPSRIPPDSSWTRIRDGGERETRVEDGHESQPEFRCISNKF